MWVLKEPDFWEYYADEPPRIANVGYDCAFSMSSGRAYITERSPSLGGGTTYWRSVEAFDIPDTVTTEDEAKAWLLAAWRMR